MPDRKSVRVALSKIKRYADYEYFFDHLDAADWITPLAAEGLFKEPPEPIREGGLVSFPGWAESRYLKRMASLAPATVLQIIRTIPPTDNPRVTADLVDAAMAMPPAIAVSLATNAEKWTRSPYQLFLPEKLGEFVSHLAVGGYPNQALRIARRLLSLQPDPRYSQPARETRLRFPLHPMARFEKWEYRTILEKYVPPLVAAAGLKTVELLADLLDEAISLSHPQSESGDDSSDQSFVWRPAIEDHEQNRDRDVRDYLVTALRNATVSVIASDPSKFGLVFEHLAHRRWAIFQRISLHLLRTAAPEQPEIVRRTLLDPDHKEDNHTFHEFWLLAKDTFSQLDGEDQQVFLSRLRVKFDQELAAAEKLDDKEQSREGLLAARAWFYRRLSILRDVLPKDWRGEYERLQAEIGEFPYPDFLTYVSPVWHGPTSPKSAEQLASMPVEDIAAFLLQWQPSDRPMEDSPEGLGRSLAAAVAADPARYAARANQFVGLDPTYVRGLISGLRDAVKEKREFPWLPVLPLCAWVLSQPRILPGRRSDYHDLDPGWTWTRKALADLLSAGLDPGPQSIPYALRDTVWAVLHPLTDDPDPDPEHEERYGGSNMDPVTLSINTTRGEAMHAAVRYGLWVRRHFEQSDGEENQLARGFDSIPELREVLEKHLDVGVEPSLAIRAVYGQWVAWLHLLDPNWTTAHVPAIYPSDPTLLELRIAAWDAYVTFGGVFNNVFDVLEPEYEAAVDRLGIHRNQQGLMGNPEKQLAEHIMTFYWRGKIRFGASEALVAPFFSRAPATLRGDALGFVGLSLKGDEVAVPPETLERLKALWEWRFEQTAKLPIEDQKEELGAFGWWFASGKFPSEWGVRQLLQLLRRTLTIDAAHMVIEQLALVARTFPGESMEILHLMVEGSGAGRGTSFSLREAGPIVSCALEGNDERARKDAVDFLHYLGAKGIDTLEHLLPRRARSADA